MSRNICVTKQRCQTRKAPYANPRQINFAGMTSAARRSKERVLALMSAPTGGSVKGYRGPRCCGGPLIENDARLPCFPGLLEGFKSVWDPGLPNEEPGNQCRTAGGRSRRGPLHARNLVACPYKAVRKHECLRRMSREVNNRQFRPPSMPASLAVEIEIRTSIRSCITCRLATI
jgi:hypothetical protein